MLHDDIRSGQQEPQHAVVDDRLGVEQARDRLESLAAGIDAGVADQAADIAVDAVEDLADVGQHGIEDKEQRRHAVARYRGTGFPDGAGDP